MSDEFEPNLDVQPTRDLETLRRQLREIAGRIDPFPPFPGAMFAYGIEVAPPAGMEGEASCVVLGNDGALYELEIGIDAGQAALGADHTAARHEALIPLDVPAATFVAYARAALAVAGAYLEDAQRRADR